MRKTCFVRIHVKSDSFCHRLPPPVHPPIFEPSAWPRSKFDQDSCKSKNAKIQITSRKQKNKKTISQDSCKCKNAKIKKTSRKPKKQGIFTFHFYCYCMLCFLFFSFLFIFVFSVFSF